MDKYETLWKNKKSELAKTVIEYNSSDLYIIAAKELARMELDEFEYDNNNKTISLGTSSNTECNNRQILQPVGYEIHAEAPAIKCGREYYTGGY